MNDVELLLNQYERRFGLSFPCNRCVENQIAHYIISAFKAGMPVEILFPDIFSIKFGEKY